MGEVDPRLTDMKGGVSSWRSRSRIGTNASRVIGSDQVFITIVALPFTTTRGPPRITQALQSLLVDSLFLSVDRVRALHAPLFATPCRRHGLAFKPKARYVNMYMYMYMLMYTHM